MPRESGLIHGEGPGGIHPTDHLRAHLFGVYKPPSKKRRRGITGLSFDLTRLARPDQLQAGLTCSLGPRGVAMKKVSRDMVGGIVVSLAVLILFVCVSFLFGDPDWLARAGPVVCFVGAWLAVRRLRRLGPETVAIQERIIDGGSFDGEPEANEEREEEKRMALDWHAARWGFWLSAFGIAIWGYGDLILKPVL